MVKRLSRIPRTNVELPDEVVDAFRQALKLRDHRERQLEDGERCAGIGGCATCDEYERLVGIVDSALGVRPTEIDAQVVDCIGEVTNMIAGAAKSRLEHLQLSLSLPTVVTGGSARVAFPSRATPISIPFRSELGPLIVEVGILA